MLWILGVPAVLLLVNTMGEIYKTQHFRSFRDTLIDVHLGHVLSPISWTLPLRQENPSNKNYTTDGEIKRKM
jgi:hypothetical protein